MSTNPALEGKSAKRKPKDEYPLVFVEWHDHWSEDAWTNVDKFDMSPVLCRSMGWLVKQDEKSISVAGSRGANDRDVAQIMVILRSCIVNMWEFKVPKPKPPKVDKIAPPVV